MIPNKILTSSAWANVLAVIYNLPVNNPTFLCKVSSVVWTDNEA